MNGYRSQTVKRLLRTKDIFPCISDVKSYILVSLFMAQTNAPQRDLLKTNYCVFNWIKIQLFHAGIISSVYDLIQRCLH